MTTEAAEKCVNLFNTGQSGFDPWQIIDTINYLSVSICSPLKKYI
jgi:hypothetical protein